MLVIMENRDVTKFFQPTLNLKASRCRDILQIDSSETLGNHIDGIYDGIHIFIVYADWKRIHIRKLFEQRTLSFHNRHTGRRADIAQSQYSGSICDYCHKIISSGQFK